MYLLDLEVLVGYLIPIQEVVDYLVKLPTNTVISLAKYQLKIRIDLYSYYGITVPLLYVIDLKKDEIIIQTLLDAEIRYSTDERLLALFMYIKTHEIA